MGLLTLHDFSRLDWGASAESPASYSNLQYGIIVHWNGPGMGAYTKEAVPGIIMGTYGYHVNTQGWADIAYNFSIDRFGRIWEGRGKDKRNAASGDNYANSSYTAVELLIGKSDPFTVDIQNGLIEFYNRYVAQGGLPKILGHRDVIATECPGEEVHAFLDIVPSVAVALNTIPLPTTLVKKVNMPHYILHLVDSKSYYACYDDGMVNTDLFWPEIEYLISIGIPVVPVTGNAVMNESRIL